MLFVFNQLWASVRALAFCRTCLIIHKLSGCRNVVECSSRCSFIAFFFYGAEICSFGFGTGHFHFSFCRGALFGHYNSVYSLCGRGKVRYSVVELYFLRFTVHANVVGFAWTVNGAVQVRPPSGNLYYTKGIHYCSDQARTSARRSGNLTYRTRKFIISAIKEAIKLRPKHCIRLRSLHQTDL